MQRDDSVVPIIVTPLCCCAVLAGVFLVGARALPAPEESAGGGAPVAATLDDPPRGELPAPKGHGQPDARAAEVPRAPPRAGRVARTSLPLLLRGTLWSANPSHSLAAVEDERDGRARSLRIGDVVDDAKVVSIHRGRLLLRRGGRFEELRVGARPANSLRSAAHAPARARRPSLTIHEEGPDTFRISRAELNRLVQEEGERHLRDVRIMPAFEGGQAVGFRLAFVRPDSLFTRLGLRQGDLIRRVNGRSLDSPEKALALYAELRDASRVDVEIDRSGTPTRLSFRLRDAGS